MNQLAHAQRTILSVLLSGKRITVAEGNRMAGTTETRKIISRLRRMGYNIIDNWLNSDGRRYKMYWIGN